MKWRNLSREHRQKLKERKYPDIRHGVKTRWGGRFEGKMEKWIYSSDSQLRHTLKSPGKRPKPSCLRPPRDPHLIGLGDGLSIGVVERCPSDKTMLPKLNAAVLGGGGGLVSNSCLTLATPWSLLSSPVHGILQARILEWVAIPFSRGSSWPTDPTWVSHIAGRFFTNWAMKEAHCCTLKYPKMLLITAPCSFIQHPDGGGNAFVLPINSFKLYIGVGQKVPLIFSIISYGKP